MSERAAYYFGCHSNNGVGHALHDRGGMHIWEPRKRVPDFPWTVALMDTGLLKNGRTPDVYDGKVYWTCARSRVAPWHAFVWWDRSGDRRPGSNSGFYVAGIALGQQDEAFAFALEAFPHIAARQRYPLVLQQ